MVQRGGKISGWLSVFGAALAVAGVIFSAGDANQRIASDGKRLDHQDAQIEALQRDFGDVKASLAAIRQSVEDTRDTAHRLERAHIVHRADD